MSLTDALRRVNRKFFPSLAPAYFPTDAWTDRNYEKWFLQHRATKEALEEQKRFHFDHRPKFSIIVPLYKTPIDYLTMMAESVLAQTYDNFELVLVNASPENEELGAAVQAIIDFDDRIKQICLDGNYGITENTNYGIDVATGDFMCFMDHDDFIEPDLLFEYAKTLNEDPSIDVLYCDEDLVEVDQKGIHYVHPLFKPAYSPDLLLCKNYIVHLMAVRSTIVRAMERPDSSYDGAQDYNMVLRATKVSRSVHNVEKVLYHWRMSDASTAANPGAKLYSRRGYRKSAFVRIQGEYPEGRIIASGIINIHNVWMGQSSRPKVSIIADCAGDADGLTSFMEALDQSTGYPDVEVIPVSDTNFSEPDFNASNISLEGIVVADGGLFDRLNAAANKATGEYLLFLRSSDVLVTPEALEQLVGLCAHGGVGAVAAKGLYSDDSVMNYGIAITPERIMPLYRGYPDEFPAYQCNTRAFQNVSAINWRGMMIAKTLFEDLGGFDVAYHGAIGGADLCHRVTERGMRILQTPTVKVQTNQVPPAERYDCEANAPDFTALDLELFDTKWPGVRAAGDPYFNRNLDQSSSYFQIPETRKER